MGCALLWASCVIGNGPQQGTDGGVGRRLTGKLSRLRPSELALPTRKLATRLRGSADEVRGALDHAGEEQTYPVDEEALEAGARAALWRHAARVVDVIADPVGDA